MTNREVREDEVASWQWLVEIGYAGNWGAAEYWLLIELSSSSMGVGEYSGILELGIHEEVGAVVEGYVFPSPVGFALFVEDLELDDGRRIDWSSIG